LLMLLLLMPVRPMARIAIKEIEIVKILFIKKGSLSCFITV